MINNNTSIFINIDKAKKYIESIENKKTKELLGNIFVSICYSKADLPENSFDVLYCIKSVEKTLENHETIKYILDGGSLDWDEM